MNWLMKAPGQNCTIMQHNSVTKICQKLTILQVNEAFDIKNKKIAKHFSDNSQTLLPKVCLHRRACSATGIIGARSDLGDHLQSDNPS